MTIEVAADEFWIRCRTCDGDGPHGWVSLPTQSTRGRWSVDHRAETGHDAWECHDGPLGKLTARQARKIAELARQVRELFDHIVNEGGAP